jgi:hypothetical protein
MVYPTAFKGEDIIMKKNSILGLVVMLPLFASSSYAASEDVVEVMLASKLDDDRGYCLDIAGGQGANAPLDRGLQAHTCYHYTGGILEDQGFTTQRVSQGEFHIAYFDVCMAASSLAQGADLALAKCDQSKEQQFTLQSNGQLVNQAMPSLCVTVSRTEKREGRGGSPVHVMRSIALESCDESKKEYQTWSLNTL